MVDNFLLTISENRRELISLPGDDEAVSHLVNITISQAEALSKVQQDCAAQSAQVVDLKRQLDERATMIEESAALQERVNRQAEAIEQLEGKVFDCLSKNQRLRDRVGIKSDAILEMGREIYFLKLEVEELNNLKFAEMQGLNETETHPP